MQVYYTFQTVMQWHCLDWSGLRGCMRIINSVSLELNDISWTDEVLMLRNINNVSLELINNVWTDET